jgi:hypothetical protein
VKVKSHAPEGGKPLCAFPGCKIGAASRGKRGQNSTTDPNGRKYFKWCNTHRRGKGKAERLALT